MMSRDQIIALLGGGAAPHKNTHKSGGSDAFVSADLLEATVKRVLESGGTTMLVGAVADGDFIKRSGTSLIGSTAIAASSVTAILLSLLGASGSQIQFDSVAESLTLSTVGATTDTSTSLLTNNSLIMCVVGRVTTTISGGGVTAFSVGDATTASRFVTASTGLSAGSTFIGFNQWKGNVTLEAEGPSQLSGAAIRVTCDGTPSAGVIRLVSFVLKGVAPTS